MKNALTFISLLLFITSIQAQNNFCKSINLLGKDTLSGKFDGPTDVTIDKDGYLYVLEGPNSRVQKFKDDTVFVTSWGSFGSEDGKFYHPYAITSDNDNNIYVVDYMNSRIQKFSSDGQFITKWGTEGTENGQFSSPVGIVIDELNNLYVSDYNRIQKFDLSGSYLGSWVTDGKGSLSVDQEGNIYLVGNYHVQKYDNQGSLLTQWGSQGSEEGQFDEPIGITVYNDHVYVTESYNNVRIQEFTLGGVFTSTLQFNGNPNTKTKLKSPYGLRFDSHGSLYVADYSDTVRIIKSCDVVTTVKDDQLKENIKVYPNPSEGLIHVDLKNETLESITLTNTLGQQETFYNTEIETKLKGLMVVKIKTEKGSYSEKLVIH